MQPSSSRNTSIDYDAATGRFLIRCPIYDNDRVRNLPNRRWWKTKAAWAAPAIRANIEALRQLFQTAEYSAAAREKLDGYENERKQAKRLSHWPSFYRFKRDPRPKQLEALEKTYGLKTIALFMDMRTGKTKVIIDMACALRIEGIVGAILILCPVSIRRNWRREIQSDATIPWDVHIAEAGELKNFERWLHTPHDFKCLIAGTESLSAEGSSVVKMIDKFMLTMPKVMIPVDESDMIKTHNATRSKKIVNYGKNAVVRVISTGTPLTQNPMDLFMQYEFLDTNIIGLGDFYSFKARYAVMGGYENKEIIGYTNMDELIELVSPFTFQVRQHEVFDHVKEKLLIELELTPQQKALYVDMKKYSAIKTSGDLKMVAQNVLEKVLRLQEIVGGFVSYQHTDEQLRELRERLGPKAKLPRSFRQPIPGRNPKADKIMELVEVHPGSWIIWCAWAEEIALMVRLLREKYGHDQVVELHGKIEDTLRMHEVETRFKTRKARFCVANTATGGVGLTMDVADVLCYYSNDNRFRNRAQSEERATAPNKSTLVIDLMVPKTTDQIILAANAVKQDISEFVRGAIDKFRASKGSAPLSIDQLVDIAEEIMAGPPVPEDEEARDNFNAEMEMALDADNADVV